MLIKSYVFEGLTREQFFETNASTLDTQAIWTNLWLRETYGSATAQLQKAEAFVPFFVEVKAANGTIDLTRQPCAFDPGLSVSPDTFADFSQDDIPRRSTARLVGTMIATFMLNLGQIKNVRLRAVGAFALYQDLFAIPQIAQSTDRSVRLLCGIVAGHFHQANYPDHTIPYFKIIEGYMFDRSINDIMQGTSFVDPKGRALADWQAEVDGGIEFMRQLH